MTRRAPRNLATAHAPIAAQRVLVSAGMKKLNKHTLSTKTSRKLALETTTLKLLSGEQLAVAHGGLTGSEGVCGSAECTQTQGW